MLSWSVVFHYDKQAPKTSTKTVQRQNFLALCVVLKPHPRNTETTADGKGCAPNHAPPVRKRLAGQKPLEGCTLGHQPECSGRP